MHKCVPYICGRELVTMSNGTTTWTNTYNADGYTSTGQGYLGNNMFAYCNNTPINLTDRTGSIATRILVFMGTSFVAGFIAGYNSDENLMDIVTDNNKSKQPQTPKVPSRIPSPSYQHEAEYNIDDSNNYSSNQSSGDLTFGEKLTNGLIGGTVGLGLSALAVSLTGAVAAVCAGSASTVIPFLGGSGAQVFAFGAAIYDIVAIGAPIIGITLDPIEYAP